MLRKHLVNDIKKYSFVKDAFIDKFRFVIIYMANGIEKRKTLPIYSSLARLQYTIKKIREEIKHEIQERNVEAITYIF